jgi:hypothetical protein
MEAPMFVVSRHFTGLRSIHEFGRRAEQGLAPILRQNPGFRGYYLMDCGDGAGFSISVFESREAAEATRDQAVGWIDETLPDFTAESSELTVGTVITRIEAQAPAAETAGAAAARPTAH